MIHLIPSLPYILKSYTAEDEGYITPDGETIIWRNVRGKTIPIKVDSSQYTDWLSKQEGVNIDPSSQVAMQQAEQILDNLQRIGESGGPAAQAQYEQKVLDALRQYGGSAADTNYINSMAKRAQAKGMTNQELEDHYAKMYDEYKKNTPNYKPGKKATNDEQWDAFISHYSGDMLSRSKDASVGSKEWGVSMAVDLAMRMLQEKAKKGHLPAQVDVQALIAAEMKNRTSLMQHFNSYVEGISDPVQHHIAAMSILDGLKAISQNIDDDTDFGKAFEAETGKVYAKMYNDYLKESNAGKFRAGKGFMPSVKMDEVPDELPDAFNEDEASALYNYYEKSGGGKLANSHKVLVHAMGRLMAMIPSDKHASIAVAMSDPKSGLHILHQKHFRRSAEDNRDGGDFDVDATVEAALRAAARAKDPATAERAIRAIAARMGEIDGYFAVRNKPKAVGKELDGLWQNSPAAAGRKMVKGEGPNLMSYITNENDRKGSFIPNKALGILHTPKGSATSLSSPTVASAQQQVNAAHATSMPNLDFSFPSESTSKEEHDYGVSDEDKAFFQGDLGKHVVGDWHRSKSNPSSFVTKEGFSIYRDADSGAATLATPDGKDIPLEYTFGDGDDVKTRANAVFNAAEKAVEKYRVQRGFSTPAAPAAPEPQKNETQEAIEEANNPASIIAPEAEASSPSEAPAISTSLQLDADSMEKYGQIKDALEQKGFSIKDIKSNIVMAKLEGGNMSISFTSKNGKLIAAIKGKKVDVSDSGSFIKFVNDSLGDSSEAPAAEGQDHASLKSSMEKLASDTGLSVANTPTGRTIISSGDESITLYKAKNGKVVLFHKEGTGKPEEISPDNLEKTVMSMKSRADLSSAAATAEEVTQEAPAAPVTPELSSMSANRTHNENLTTGFTNASGGDGKELRGVVDSLSGEGLQVEGSSDMLTLEYSAGKFGDKKGNKVVLTHDRSGRMFATLNSSQGNSVVPIDDTFEQRVREHLGFKPKEVSEAPQEEPVQEDAAPTTTVAAPQAAPVERGPAPSKDSDPSEIKSYAKKVVSSLGDKVFGNTVAGDPHMQAAAQTAIAKATQEHIATGRDLDEAIYDHLDQISNMGKMDKHVAGIHKRALKEVSAMLKADGHTSSAPENPSETNETPQTTNEPAANEPTQSAPAFAPLDMSFDTPDSTATQEPTPETTQAPAKIKTPKGKKGKNVEGKTEEPEVDNTERNKNLAESQKAEMQNRLETEFADVPDFPEGLSAEEEQDFAKKNPKSYQKKMLQRSLENAGDVPDLLGTSSAPRAGKSSADRRAQKEARVKGGLKGVSAKESLERVAAAKEAATPQETSTTPTNTSEDVEEPRTKAKVVGKTGEEKGWTSPSHFTPDTHSSLVDFIESSNGKSIEETAKELSEKFPDSIDPNMAEYYVHSIRNKTKEGKKYRELADFHKQSMQ